MESEIYYHNDLCGKIVFSFFATKININMRDVVIGDFIVENPRMIRNYYFQRMISAMRYYPCIISRKNLVSLIENGKITDGELMWCFDKFMIYNDKKAYIVSQFRSPMIWNILSEAEIQIYPEKK